MVEGSLESDSDVIEIIVSEDSPYVGKYESVVTLAKSFMDPTRIYKKNPEGIMALVKIKNPKTAYDNRLICPRRLK